MEIAIKGGGEKIMGNLDHQRIAILVANGFEQVELTEPKKALEQAGATTDIVSPENGKVRGWNFTDWGDEFTVDTPLDRQLRRNERALNFVREFFASGKPVAVICHGPWTLIDAGLVRGRKMTSYHSIQMDLKNAGANWVDQEVVVDAGLVTSRKPSDIPAFNRKMIEEFAEGMHGGQMAEFAERIHVPQR
jgi:protease I